MCSAVCILLQAAADSVIQDVVMDADDDPDEVP
jgi:hypothetical protein